MRGEDGKLTGKRFGRLMVVEKTRQSDGRDWWLCRCDCGREKEIVGKSLRRGLTKSCGCGVVEASTRRMTTHGLSKHPLYRVYKNIKNRCNNSATPRFADYGGRGIKCLFNGARDFIEWALEQGWESGLTIDRRDNDGHYSRDNCRIADNATQNRNSRRNRTVTINGSVVCFKDAATLLGVKYATAMKRLQRGCTSEQALGMEPCPRSR